MAEANWEKRTGVKEIKDVRGHRVLGTLAT
jgi:hypothetical protein